MVRQPSASKFPKSLQWVLMVYSACFLAVYFILRLKYRISEIDDVDWVTFAYNYIHNHTTGDPFTGTPSPFAGITLFGKTYAFILGVLLNVIGFTKSNSYLVSLLFILGGFACWYPTLRRLQYSRELSATFCVTGLLLDPFFSAELFAREEAFIFFIGSLALLLFVRENYFLALLVSWFSLETHPTGAFPFFLIAGAFFAIRPPKGPHPFLAPKNLFPALVGFALGAFYFFSLHSDVLNAQLPGILLSGNKMDNHSIQNFLFDYFFHSKYHRHLVDLGLLVLCFVEFFRKRMFTQDRFVIPLTLSLLAFCLIFERPEYHYVLYFYPVFLLVLAKVFEARWGLVWMAGGLLALFLPQYAYAYHLNRDFDFNLEVRNYQRMIPADNLPVFGPADAWYAFPGREVHFNQYWGDIQKLDLKSFYLIQDEGFREKPTDATAYIQNHFTAKPIGDFTVGHRQFFITLEEPK
jgi:hypothetical protein